jgi:hypothetical protein
MMGARRRLSNDIRDTCRVQHSGRCIYMKIYNFFIFYFLILFFQNEKIEDCRNLRAAKNIKHVNDFDI